MGIDRHFGFNRRENIAYLLRLIVRNVWHYPLRLGRYRIHHAYISILSIYLSVVYTAILRSETPMVVMIVVTPFQSYNAIILSGINFLFETENQGFLSGYGDEGI